MNPVSMIFVLIAFSGLQDYGITPVSGYDARTARDICECANGAYNKFNNSYGLDHFTYVIDEIDNDELNTAIRELLISDDMMNEFKTLMSHHVPDVDADYVLGN